MANKWIGTGNLTKDVETSFTKDGTCIARFSIACNERWTDRATGEKKESVEYVNLTAFGKLGEICQQYLAKGKKVYIEGKLKTDTWEKDGITRKQTNVIVKEMEMLGGATQQANERTAEKAEDESIPF